MLGMWGAQMSLIFSRGDVLYMTDDDGDAVEVPTRREFVEVAIETLRAKYNELSEELRDNPNDATLALSRKRVYENLTVMGTLLNPTREA